MTNSVLSVECNEPEGTVKRTVRLAEISIGRLRHYYEKMSDFPVLFNDWVKNDPESFIKGFVHITPEGNARLQGLIWEVDDVGIIFLTDLVPGWQAQLHLTFWDRRFKGRELLFRKMIAYLMKLFDLHRIYAEVPLYAQAALKATERVGFVKEGRLRQSVLYDGEWFDANLYSILKSEVSDVDEA